jgi:hypothetical protein
MTLIPATRLFPELAAEPLRFVMLCRIARKFDNVNSFLYWCRQNLWWDYPHIRLEDRHILKAVRDHVPGRRGAYAMSIVWEELRKGGEG